MDFSLFGYLHSNAFGIWTKSQLGIFVPSFLSLYKKIIIIRVLVTKHHPDIQKPLFWIF
jgi:hypothetical protein